MKKRFTIFFVFILLFLSPINLFIFNANASNNWIIDGDTVYIDDENVYLSATPHTLINDGVVVFELETESYDGDIDIAWGFDIPSCTPHNPQIWRNYTHELIGYHYVDRIGSIEIYNVTGWINLGIENYDNYTVDYGNNNNTYLMNISYENYSFLIVAFTTYVEFGDGDDYRLTGHYDSYESYIYYETFFDWQNWDADFEIIYYEYGGMNTWFLLKDIPVVHSHRYKVRAFIDIPFNTDGKYWWCLKPSDKTIQQAINDNTFYCLDPWWNSNWGYHRMITINHDYIDTDLTNFPVLVIVNDSIADNCNGGDSIRFLHLDNTTEYFYEIEKWVDNEDRIVWVNITSISSSVDTEFLMYYGNVDASDNQYVSDVWNDDYLMIHHLVDTTTSTITDSSINSNDGDKKGVNEPIEINGNIGYGQDFDGTNDEIQMHDTVGLSSLGSKTISYWFKSSDYTNINAHISKDWGSSNNREWIFLNKRHTDYSHRVYYYEFNSVGNDYLLSATSLVNVSDGSWHHLAFTWDGVNAVGHMHIWIDGIDRNLNVYDYKDGTGCTPHDGVADVEFGRYASSNANCMDGILDEIRLSGSVFNDSWIKASYHSENSSNHLGAFLIIGAESIRPNVQPVLSVEYPDDSAVGVTLFPVLGITIVDSDADDMIITWYSNVSGSWVIIGSNLSGVYNGTYYQKFDEFGIYGLTYYWNVSVTDGYYFIDSDIFKFTAETTPTTDNEGEIGLLGIFGFLGFLLYRRFHKKSNDKK